MKKMGQPMIGLVGALSLSMLVVLGQAMPCHAETKLIESPLAAYAYFGTSVSSGGNLVVVGVPSHDNYKGAVYVYKLNGTAWELTAELTAGDGAQSDMFGQSVAISGSTVVVGAPNHSGTVSFSGAAYIFKNNGSLWELSAKLTALDAAESDGFGVSVSVSGDTIVVGSPGQGDPDSGAAYVFTFNGTLWEQVAKLSDVAVVGSNFAQSVSISGDTIVVGAYWDTAHDAVCAGAAYVFKHDSTGWVQMEKLTASDAAMFDGFGFSVSVSGNTIVVGAPWDEGSTGAAYLFKAEGTDWVVEKVTASDAATGDLFGSSVSISDDTVIVGAPWKDDGGSEVSQVMSAGAAYVFILEGEPSIEFFVDIKPGSCVNPVNPKSKGVLPVALLGTEGLDVMMIDPSTIRLSRDGVDGEVAPIRVHYADVATPMQCELTASGEIEGDGYTDLMLKFRTQEVVKALSLWDVAGERVTLTLTANLKEEFGGSTLSAQDDIKVLGKKPKPPKKPKK
jgi:hypothetical protein